MSLTQFISKKKENVNIEIEQPKNAVLPVNENLLLSEYENGLQAADSCNIPYLDQVFSWKRGFQNCFTGYPNDGKTTMVLFLMTVKSLTSKWKWVVWSPEMKSGSFVNGAVHVHYNDLINEIIWMADGRTPYRHIVEKFRCDRIPVKDYLELIHWVREHFITLDPKEKKPEDIYTTLYNIYQDQGFDGILIDPFKNVEQDIRIRDDIYLEQLFARFKDLGVRCNAVMNWIGHPKANVQRIREGTLMPCDQYMLNGGAAWDNSMDGIYSVFRFDLLNDIRSKHVNFLNLKQRKQELTTERGACTGIEFDPKNRRYIFQGYDPILRKHIESDYSLPYKDDETPF